MAATSGRARNRHRARSGAPGPAAEHRSKIMAALVTGAAVIVAFLALTGAGHGIDAATQRFMLFYAGVFALIGLTVSVAVGLIATDRVILTPGHRVLAQAVHRAVSFGALAFLIVHIVTEILAQRVHVIDAFVPFMSPFRTFYIGLGTISSDLILLLVATSIVRKRFTAHGKAWRWRAIHYTAYLSFVFGVTHGLMAGRSAKPYVDWSYGFAIALVALGLVVRFLAISLRPKESLSMPPAGHRSFASRAGSLSLAQAQLGGSVQMLPARVPSVQMPSVRMSAAQMSAAQMLSAPMSAAYPQPALASLPASHAQQAPYAQQAQRQPRYEPGYLGPPRYEGASRNTGPFPRVDTGPMPRVDPRVDSGSFPRVDSGPFPRVDTGPFPRVDTGPIPRVDTGPMPRIDTGPIPRVRTGPAPRPGTGPMQRAGTGPMPRIPAAQMPPADSGPMPRIGARRADTGSPPWHAPGPAETTGPIPRTGPPPDGRARDPRRPAPRGRPEPYAPDSYTPDSYTPDSYAPEPYRPETRRQEPYRPEPRRQEPRRPEPYSGRRRQAPRRRGEHGGDT